METTPTSISLLQEVFYTPADLNTVINVVANNFFILLVVLLGTYPFLMILKKLIRYCENAFDNEAIRKMEGGGIWQKLPEASLHSGLIKLGEVKVFDKLTRSKKGGAK